MMNRLAAVIIACLVCLGSAPAKADEADTKPLGLRTGARATIGTGGYVGRGAHLQFGDAWKIKASYSDYRFNGSTGTTRTGGLRGSYQGDHLSLGLTASVTPRNDFYANHSFGADGSWTFFFDEDDSGSGFEDFELGAFWSQTRHSQLIPITPAQPVQRNVIINQHDLGLSAAITGWDTTLSVDASRSVYDQDFDNLPAAARRRPRLSQTVALVNGFPERSGSVRLEYAGWRACVPYISAATTRYQIQPQPATLTSSAGVTLRSGGLGVDLGYELVRQKGTADTKYFNFGGSFKF